MAALGTHDNSAVVKDWRGTVRVGTFGKLPASMDS